MRCNTPDAMFTPTYHLMDVGTKIFGRCFPLTLWKVEITDSSCLLFTRQKGRKSASVICTLFHARDYMSFPLYTDHVQIILMFFSRGGRLGCSGGMQNVIPCNVCWQRCCLGCILVRTVEKCGISRKMLQTHRY